MGFTGEFRGYEWSGLGAQIGGQGLFWGGFCLGRGFLFRGFEFVLGFLFIHSTINILYLSIPINTRWDNWKPSHSPPSSNSPFLSAFLPSRTTCKTKHNRQHTNDNNKHKRGTADRDPPDPELHSPLAEGVLEDVAAVALAVGFDVGVGVPAARAGCGV